ncbi:MAG: GDYXXLXY domain-containing protein [Candidatus Hydrogenedentes bacterium]|nr:GDYXXLXY domain-containing protein [Candidatus Hydrogenedentota bacterium]
MKASARLGLLAAVALAQIAVPANMILSLERTLSEGTLCRFRTAPVDPYDAFRGRYVRLAIEESSGPLPEGPIPEPGQTVYARIETDAEGISKIAEVLLDPPDQGVYIRATAGWADTGQRILHVNLPIDRYYMNEWKAPAAEQAYWDQSRMAQRNAFVHVRVRNGEAAVEGLYIGAVPIEEYVAQQSEPSGGNEP